MGPDADQAAEQAAAAREAVALGGTSIDFKQVEVQPETLRLGA